MQYICKICGKIFINDNKANVTKEFKKHLLSEHKLSLKNYIINYYYDGIIPKCSCGCGNDNIWLNKNVLFDKYHGFSKYCSCTHVNGIPKKESIINENNNLTKYTCLECNKDFYVNNHNSKKILNHIKSDHNISLETYILKHYFNNQIPKCQCGCEEELKFKHKNALWKPLESFKKYVNCTHACRNNYIQKQSLHQNYITKWENIEWVKNHYYEQYGKDLIEESANDFLNNYNYTKYDFKQKYGIDYRTLKNIWFKLNLVTKEQYNEKIKYTQFKLSSKRRKQKFDNKEEICAILYNIIKNFPQQYNISSLIKYYNDNNLIQIETDKPIVLKTLVELYGEEIYEYLQYGLHSKEEIEFIKVLKYLVKGKYKIGLRLQYGKNKKESYIYDICINNKYIIEYDSIGIYHINHEQDKLKEQFAINKGYKIIRISYQEFRDPNTYIKINKWINND